MHTFPIPGRPMLLPEISHADNCHLIDADGKRYLDLESGIWCACLGHAHPEVNRALAEQAARLAHVGFCYSSPVVERCAALLLELTGLAGGRQQGQEVPEGRCALLCSGSEAVEYGVRVLRALCGEQKILTMADSYFGAYGDAAAKAPEGWRLFDWTECQNCDREQCDQTCARWASIPFAEIGAFLFEPGSSSGLVRFPPERLIRAIAQTLRASDGLLMANEVTTGMGRTGRWFGFEHYDFQPDIVALGKGLGNGYPVSACCIGPRTADRLGPAGLPYAQSHINDPLGAAVAQAVVGVIRDQDLIARAGVLSDILLSGLQGMAQGSRLVQSIRGRGLMAVLELAEEVGVEGTARLHAKLVHQGFITDHRPGTCLLRMDPALTMEERDLRDFLQTLGQNIQDMAAQG